MPSKRTPLWTAQVHFMTGHRWEGPFVIAVDATTPSAAAARAIRIARTRLKRRARTLAVKLSLQRQAAPTPNFR